MFDLGRHSPPHTGEGARATGKAAMKLGYARIFVKDLDAMVQFYADTLGLPKGWHHSTGLTAGDQQNGHAGFETGDCTLILERGRNEEAGNRFTALVDTPCAP